MKKRKTKEKTYLAIAAGAVCLLALAALLLCRFTFSENRGSILINEVSPSLSFCPEGRGFCSWIEVYNCTDQEKDLSGFSLSAGSGDPYIFTEGSLIPAGGYALLHFGTCESACSSAFSLSGHKGEWLTLAGPDGKPEASVLLLSVEADQSLVRAETELLVSDEPSPGFENSEDGRQEYLSSITDGMDSLRISEVMVKNHSVFQAADGTFPDWVELENCSGSPVDTGGWFLSDDEDKYGCALPGVTLQPGQRLLILADGNPSSEDEVHVDFSLSSGETVCLYTPYGLLADSLLCDTDTANHSIARDENGEAFETKWSTPAAANTKAGYEAWCSGRASVSPLVINEVMAANQSYLRQQDIGGFCDWVELKNVSDSTVQLSDYWLSDDEDDYLQWQLPDISLTPGETYIVYCTNDLVDSSRSGFSLDVNEEDLFLCTSSAVADYVYLHDLPVNGSIGRMDGKAGFFYFYEPSPLSDNYGGYRFASEKPEAITPDGVYENVDSVSVELSSPGTVYYTTDGSVPTTASAVYNGPITVNRTTVIRAIAVEEDAVPSRVLTLSYIVNEGHTLPVLSLVTDNRSAFRSMYFGGIKYWETPGSLSLYENGEGFTIACGISMKGWTSLEMPKKSMGVSFRGCYGDGDLEYDVLGNGIDLYSGLAIRGGQDYPLSVIRNELFQTLCLEATEHVFTQESKYCILYINGEYYGIYCLKEDFSRQYYASHTGCSKESVTMLKSPIETGSDLFREVFSFCYRNDMTDSDNYAHFCSLFDVDSLIDWIILEGYSANSDVNGNMRYLRSSENGGKWQIAFYDLDWTFRNLGGCFDNIINPSRVLQISPLINVLLQNEAFSMQLAERCVELSRGPLSNQNVLEKIDQFQTLLEPEMARERERWGSTVSAWFSNLDQLRRFITESDYENYMVERLFKHLGLSAEQREALLTGKDTT